MMLFSGYIWWVLELQRKANCMVANIGGIQGNGGTSSKA